MDSARHRRVGRPAARLTGVGSVLLLLCLLLGGCKATARSSVPASSGIASPPASASAPASTSARAGASPSSSAPGSPTAVPTKASTLAITVGSTQRSYLLYAPAVSHRPLPLVVVLHGLGASPTDESNRTGFGALAARDQAVVAFPAGVNGDWNVGNGCCAHHGQTPAAVDDGAFVSAVVTAIEGTERIDRTRVYLVGYSAGGKLAWRFACAGGGPFAAVATYGAVPVTACSSTGAGISVLVADGTADTELPYGGSSTQQPPTQAVSTVVDEWRTRDGCPPASATSSPGPAVTVQTWDGCAGNMSVSFVRYPGLDHRWPDVAIRPAYADGATIFWAWLSRQHRS